MEGCPPSHLPPADPRPRDLPIDPLGVQRSSKLDGGCSSASCASLPVTINYLFVVGVEDKEAGHPHFELHSLGEQVMDALPLLGVQVLPSLGGQDLVCKEGKTSKTIFS